MKKVIIIICLASLIISMCGLSIYKAYEKHMYKVARIKYINTHPLTEMDGLITLTISSIDQLPNGYDWEDKGTEFVYKGMMYDVINIINEEAGITILALADAPEISLNQKHVQLAQQQKESSSKSKQIFKWMFVPYLNTQKVDLILHKDYCSSAYPIMYQDIVFITIEKNYVPPEMG